MENTLSFEDSRQEMLDTVREHFQKTETKIIQFEDNEVPAFLERLDAFEKASRESAFMVG